MITQSKLAKLAGVSRTTVARVINNKGYVSEETRQKILELIKVTSYKPNKAGKTLAIQQKKIKIGCILIQADNPFYQELNKGILIKAEEYKTYGIEVIVKNAVFKTDEQIKIIDELIAGNINALLIQPIIDTRLVKKLEEVAKLNIPIVMVNTDIPDFQSAFCYVGNDFYLCGKTAANLLELFTHGSCKIGIITGFFNAKSHADRIHGFKDYISDFPDMKIIDIQENHDDEWESYHITKEMLDDHPEIDALFVVAGGVYGAGRAVKDYLKDRKITVISFDDVPTTRELVREGVILATICQQPIRQGQLALEALFNYFVDGTVPVNKRIYTDIHIKLKANIDT